jgi:hypothetical protein
MGYVNRGKHVKCRELGYPINSLAWIYTFLEKLFPDFIVFITKIVPPWGHYSVCPLSFYSSTVI